MAVNANNGARDRGQARGSRPTLREPDKPACARELSGAVGEGHLRVDGGRPGERVLIVFPACNRLYR